MSALLLAPYRRKVSCYVVLAGYGGGDGRAELFRVFAFLRGRELPPVVPPNAPWRVFVGATLARALLSENF